MLLEAIEEELPWKLPTILLINNGLMSLMHHVFECNTQMRSLHGSPVIASCV